MIIAQICSKLPLKLQLRNLQPSWVDQSSPIDIQMQHTSEALGSNIFDKRCWGKYKTLRDIEQIDEILIADLEFLLKATSRPTRVGRVGGAPGAAPQGGSGQCERVFHAWKQKMRKKQLSKSKIWMYA